KMIAQHFDQISYGSAAANYQRFFVPAIGAPLAQALVHHASLREGERVLDAACGTGVVARLAAEQVGAEGTVVGLDVNPGMVAVARTVASTGASIDWREASAESMPLPDDSFDVVLCQLGLQFMADRLAALREMRRVLVDGGRMLLNVGGQAGRHFTVLSEAMERRISPMAAGFVRQVFALNDPSEIERLMIDAGFEDVSVVANTGVLR